MTIKKRWARSEEDKAAQAKARKEGEKTYPGDPCISCGTSLRRAASGRCHHCMRKKEVAALPEQLNRQRASRRVQPLMNRHDCWRNEILKKRWARNGD